MKKYLNEFHKQEPSQISTMNKYINAYKMNHEKQQSDEEIQSEKITKQNQEQTNANKIQKRSVPSPPELLKFELSDARTNYHSQHNENVQRKSKVLPHHPSSMQQHQPTTTHKLQTKMKKDMSAQESIMVKITHPVVTAPSSPQKNENRIRIMNNQFLPIGVQNMIHMLALTNNKNNMPKELKIKATYNLDNDDNEKSKYAPSSLEPELAVYNRYPSYKTENDNHFWDLFGKNRQKRILSRPQYLSNYIRYPSYVLPLYQSLDSNTILANQYKSAFPQQLNKVITAKLPNIDSEFSPKYYNYPLNEKIVQIQPLVNFGDQQTSLFRPSAELTEEVLPIVEKEIGKESTAPILFPLDARLPKTDSETPNKTVIFGTSIVHPSPTPNIVVDEVAINPDLTKFLKDGGGLLSSGGYFPKDHTPIIEVTDEIRPTQSPSHKPDIGFVQNQNEVYI